MLGGSRRPGPRIYREQYFRITMATPFGNIQVFPEIDRAGWFAYDAAKVQINEQQAAFLEELVHLLANR